MQYIKIEVDPVILEVSAWATFTLPPGKTVPRIYRIKDGAAKLYFSNTTYQWVPSNDVAGLEIHNDASIEYIQGTTLDTPSAGISEATLLKAIAVAQDPSLIKTFDFK
jgi:hypothetical protein